MFRLMLLAVATLVVLGAGPAAAGDSGAPAPDRGRKVFLHCESLIAGMCTMFEAYVDTRTGYRRISYYDPDYPRALNIRLVITSKGSAPDLSGYIEWWVGNVRPAKGYAVEFARSPRTPDVYALFVQTVMKSVDLPSAFPAATP